MDRTARLTSFWGWLPAFRVVAEAEHLPTASRRLHVSSSALSRTIRLLEEDLGTPLFDRVGRRLILNEAGRALLAVVRDAMRLVDEGLQQVGGQLAGPVHISVTGALAPIFVVPAVDRVREAHPGVVPYVRSHGDFQLRQLLMRGNLDVALTDAVLPGDELAVQLLATLSQTVFCGAGHPLAGVPSPSREEVLSHPFVVPPPDADGRPLDDWPPQFERRVGLYVDQMQAAVDTCKGGGYLVALPTVVGTRNGLTPVPFDPLPDTPLYAVHRASLPTRGRAEVVVDALRAVAQQTMAEEAGRAGMARGPTQSPRARSSRTRRT